MASIIKIKRSGTSGSPSSLKLGEFAYSYLTGTQSNGGDRLYIGTGGVNGSGNANNIDVVGGKYFTDLLDHVPGTLSLSSAIITDANSKIDHLIVDNSILMAIRSLQQIPMVIFFYLQMVMVRLLLIVRELLVFPILQEIKTLQLKHTLMKMLVLLI